MRINKKTLSKGGLIFSWSLYDLANQFFALNVVSLYLPRWLTVEKGYSEITYSIVFAISMFFVAICAPVLGTVSDISKRHRSFLIFFTLLSVAFTIFLGISSNVFFALLFFAIANFGCQTAIVFYNALMRRITPEGKIGLVSGLGRMFGYSGAIVAIYCTKPVVLKMGYQPAFVLTGILFLLFALPCMIFIKEKPDKRDKLRNYIKPDKIVKVFVKMKENFFDEQGVGRLRNFFIASFFGLCAVNTVLIFMAVYASKVFGLGEEQIIDLIVFSTIFAIVGSILSGFVSDYIGYKRSLIGIFTLWGICIICASLCNPPFQYLIGALAGLSVGATWAVARALIIQVVPETKIGEAFGLFNSIGYMAAIVGPMTWGILLTVFTRFTRYGHRLTFFSLIFFVITAVFFLLKMEEE